MSTLPNRYITEQEYLAFERESPIKHEYYRGEVFAMTGATREHNLIVANLVRRLGNQLDGKPCETYPSDMHVWIEAVGLYAYPHVSVVCGEPEFRDGHFDTLLNPRVVIEVLSDSSENYDRGKKAEHYRKNASVDHLLLVAQDRAHLELYSRGPEGTWILTEADQLDQTIELPAIDCRLLLAEVYDKVKFPEPTTAV